MKSDTLSWSDDLAIERVAAVLAAQKVALVSTDTIPGLLAPIAPAAYKALNLLKGRFDKPYLILLPDRHVLSQFTDQKLSDDVQDLITGCWPGPVTFLFTARSGLPTYVTGGAATVGVRVPDHRELRELAYHFQGLFSTSANHASEPAPCDLEEVDAAIRAGVACVIDDGESAGAPSTIVDCSAGVPHIVREGAVSRALLEEYYGGPIT